MHDSEPCSQPCLLQRPRCPNVAPQFLATDTLKSEYILAGMYLPLSIPVTSLPKQVFGCQCGAGWQQRTVL